MDCRVNRNVGSSRRRLLLASSRIATTETEPYRSAERTGANPTKATTSFKHFVSSCELGHDTLARQEAFSSCGLCHNRSGLVQRCPTQQNYHPPHPAIDSNRSRTSLPTTDRLRSPRCSLTASCQYDILMILVEENGSNGMPQIGGAR